MAQLIRFSVLHMFVKVRCALIRPGVRTAEKKKSGSTTCNYLFTPVIERPGKSRGHYKATRSQVQLQTHPLPTSTPDSTVPQLSPIRKGTTHLKANMYFLFPYKSMQPALHLLNIHTDQLI